MQGTDILGLGHRICNWSWKVGPRLNHEIENREGLLLKEKQALTSTEGSGC